jgi:hypothetical protein
MSKLEDELKKERERAEAPPPQPPPNIEQQIKDFKAKQDLESLQLGYENFKKREDSIVGREEEVAKGFLLLAKDREIFETEQKKRLDTYNIKTDDFNKEYELFKTTKKEAERIMTEALQKKSEADRIIKAQTEAEKIAQEKSEAYEANMVEALGVFEEIGEYLIRCGTTWMDAKVQNVGKILQIDLSLIQRLQEKKVNNSTIAEVIAVDCDRMIELAEYLQDGKLRYNPVKVLDYLNKNTDWICESLKIDWSPATTRGL